VSQIIYPVIACLAHPTEIISIPGRMCLSTVAAFQLETSTLRNLPPGSTKAHMLFVNVINMGCSNQMDIKTRLVPIKRQVIN